MKKEDGSALLWSIILCFVLLIVITGALRISYLYEKRSLEAHAQVQAYASAQSMTDGLAQLIQEGSEQERSALIPTDEEHPIHIPSVEFSLSDVAMGIGSAVITKQSEHELTIQADVVMFDQTQTVVVRMIRRGKGWQVVQYDEKTPE